MQARNFTMVVTKVFSCLLINGCDGNTIVKCEMRIFHNGIRRDFCWATGTPNDHIWRSGGIALLKPFYFHGFITIFPLRQALTKFGVVGRSWRSGRGQELRFRQKYHAGVSASGKKYGRFSTARKFGEVEKIFQVICSTLAALLRNQINL